MAAPRLSPASRGPRQIAIQGENCDLTAVSIVGTGPNPIVDELISRTGAILSGNRTFSGDDPLKGQPGEGEAFGGGWDGPQFVLTHRPPADSIPGVTFVGDIDTAIVRLEQLSVTHTQQQTNLWYRLIGSTGANPAYP